MASVEEGLVGGEIALGHPQLWFEDEEVFRGTVRYLATSIMTDEVVEDEKRLFDRARFRMTTVVERESALAK